MEERTEQVCNSQCIEVCVKTFAEEKNTHCFYFPCKGYTTSTTDFCQCIDELSEIMVKQSCSHNILIGADVNEDLTTPQREKRSIYLQEFLWETGPKLNCSDLTFFQPNVQHSSEIDYFFYTRETNFTLCNKGVLDIAENVSDHKPIVTEISGVAKIRKRQKRESMFSD